MPSHTRQANHSHRTIANTGANTVACTSATSADHPFPPYRWDFEDAGRRLEIALEPSITTNDMHLMVATALAGGGFTLGLEATFWQHIERGNLVPVLEAYCPSFPGFYLYYPQRRNHPPKLRALLDHVRRAAKQL